MGKNKYKIPVHIRNYVKKELYDYKKNKLIIIELQKKPNNINSHSILVATQRINQIEEILNRLNEEDEKAVKIIFFDKKSQVKAEMEDNLTKGMYYYVMNKVIYLVAEEMNLI